MNNEEISLVLIVLNKNETQALEVEELEVALNLFQCHSKA